jgi:hypothetical protein
MVMNGGVKFQTSSVLLRSQIGSFYYHVACVCVCMCMCVYALIFNIP